MEKDPEDKKRSHLRLVVNNIEKRSTRAPAAPEDPFISLEELMGARDELRPEFYSELPAWHARVYSRLERFLQSKELPYGLDPHHGHVLVVPAVQVCPEEGEYGGPQDEVLLFVADDAAAAGICLSLEMIIPFYDDDPSVMEDALLYSPILQYGSIFLEENRQDGLLDLIYRLALPMYPPAPTSRLLERFFAIAGHELTETLRALFEYPEGT